MKKLLIVSDSLGFNNGAHVATRAMIAALRARGVCVDVMLGGGGREKVGGESRWTADRLSSGCMVYLLPEPVRGIRWFVQGVYRRLKIAPVPRWVIDPWGKMRRVMRGYDTILVIGENSHYRHLVAGVSKASFLSTRLHLYTAKKKSPRKVVFVHTDYVSWKTSCDWAIEDARFDRRIYRGFDVIGVVGEANAARFRQYYPEFAEKTHAFHNLFFEEKKVGGENRWTKDDRSECKKIGGENRWTADRRALAEMKIAEWLAGVDEATFEAALVRLVEEKTVAGEYRFKKPEERELALEGARKFYREFSRKIVPLSDGRYVYFAPDERAKTRNSSNAISWAEYAFHAVSNGGAKVAGKNYNERWYNPHKQPVFALIEGVLKQEKCFIRLSSAGARFHAIVFAGTEDTSARLQVVTRLDDAGNIDANLSEVTFTASHKEKKLPRLVPLTEAVRTVVHYQTATGSYPSNKSSIAFYSDENKGANLGSDKGGEDAASTRLVTISRLELGPPKMMERLVRVAGALKRRGCRFDWKVYGKGRAADEARLKELAREENVDDMLHFVGFTSDVRGALAEADLHVLLSAYEGAPNVIIEAQLAGVPCIATDVGAVREMIAEGAGLVLPHDENAIVDAMAEVLGNVGKLSGWKEKLKGYRYDNERVMSEYGEMFRQPATSSQSDMGGQPSEARQPKAVRL